MIEFDDADNERIAAENGLWALADLHVPPDVREMAQRWKLEQTIVEMYRNAFINGWRARERLDRAPGTGGTG